MRYVVICSAWQPSRVDLNSEWTQVTSKLRDQLQQATSMVGVTIKHDGYMLEVVTDVTSETTRTLTCKAVKSTGSTTRLWELIGG